MLQAASYQPPQVSDDEEEEYDQTHSAEMVEKEEAFVQLSMYVNEMRGAYAPFLEQTMAIALAGIQSLSDGVREVRQTQHVVSDTRLHASLFPACCKSQKTPRYGSPTTSISFHYSAHSSTPSHINAKQQQWDKSTNQ